jgi:uncharacterized protein (TIGR02757 family)
MNMDKSVNNMIKLSKRELGEFLNEKVIEFETRDFIKDDPISIPHMFSDNKDIEIAGFLAATIAWGNRKSILKNANRLMERMDNSPYDFVMNFEKADEKVFEGFCHRTFQPEDAVYFMGALRRIVREYGSLENLIASNWKASGSQDNVNAALSNFHAVFFDSLHADRTRKHVANPSKGSAAKRLNMYLRWMVRSSKNGVDLGIWDKIPTRVLSIPLDVHTSNVGRSLGLLNRKQNDWKAVAELDAALREYDPVDPVKFDFALFGLGAIEGF